MDYIFTGCFRKSCTKDLLIILPIYCLRTLYGISMLGIVRKINFKQDTNW